MLTGRGSRLHFGSPGILLKIINVNCIERGQEEQAVSEGTREKQHRRCNPRTAKHSSRAKGVWVSGRRESVRGAPGTSLESMSNVRRMTNVEGEEPVGPGVWDVAFSFIFIFTFVLSNSYSRNELRDRRTSLFARFGRAARSIDHCNILVYV